MAFAPPVWSQETQKQNTQTLSYELRYASSDSSSNNRVRERYTHILRCSKNFHPRAKFSVYLLNSTLEARNPFGKSDADINGAGFGLTYQTGAFTTATIGFGINDNAEIFAAAGGPVASNGDAKTLSFGLQRLMGQGPRSYLTAAINHAVSDLDQNFGGPFSDIRQVTSVSALYGYRITGKTVLTASARSLFSTDRFTAHLVDQANYVSLGATHRIIDTFITLRATSGVGNVAGDTQVSFKIGYYF
ncbi:MAG: hypothetical protein AAF641_10725 [Pseudomonadota bacterium]